MQGTATTTDSVGGSCPSLAVGVWLGSRTAPRSYSELETDSGALGKATEVVFTPAALRVSSPAHLPPPYDTRLEAPR